MHRDAPRRQGDGDAAGADGELDRRAVAREVGEDVDRRCHLRAVETPRMPLVVQTGEFGIEVLIGFGQFRSLRHRLIVHDPTDPRVVDSA